MYRLFVDSDTAGPSFDPEFDLTDDSKKFEARHRVRSGANYTYKLGMQHRFKMGVRFVDSSFAAMVNSAWSNNTDLFFAADSSDIVYLMRIKNRMKPINRYIRPYDTLFGGVIELESHLATEAYCMRIAVPIGDYGSVAVAVSSSYDYGSVADAVTNCNIDWGAL